MPQYTLPTYIAIDLRLGVNLGNRWLQLYCKNPTDERGQLPVFAGTSLYRSAANVSMRHRRTFGLSLRCGTNPNAGVL